MLSKPPLFADPTDEGAAVATASDEQALSASVEEVLAALDLIEAHLADDDDVEGMIGLDADVHALDAAIRMAAPGWTNGQGLEVLARVDQVMLRAMQRRTSVGAALDQHSSSKRAAARYGAY